MEFWCSWNQVHVIMNTWMTFSYSPNHTHTHTHRHTHTALPLLWCLISKHSVSFKMIIHDGFLIDFWLAAQRRRRFHGCSYITAVDTASIWRGRLAQNMEICELQKGCTYWKWLGPGLRSEWCGFCRTAEKHISHIEPAYMVVSVWEKCKAAYVWLFCCLWHKSICHFWRAYRKKHAGEYVIKCLRSDAYHSAVLYQIYGCAHLRFKVH